jgi:hypothetical protein
MKPMGDSEDDKAKLVVWMEMRSEIAMQEAAMVALYSGATETQFVELARRTFERHARKRDERVQIKLLEKIP